MTTEEIKADALAKKPLGNQMEYRDLKIGLFTSNYTTHNFERYLLENKEDLDLYADKFPQIQKMGVYDNMLKSILDGRNVIATDEHPMSGFPTYQLEGNNFDHPSSAVRLKVLELEKLIKHEEETRFKYDAIATRLNTTAITTRNPISLDDWGLQGNMTGGLFFKPDLKFVEWLVNYADGRVIVDVGAGQGHLVRMIKQVGGRSVGLEPNFNAEAYREYCLSGGYMPELNEILPMTIQQAKGIVSGMGKKALLVFARPCHSDFVEYGLTIMSDQTEALYITVPENLERYNDLGMYKKNAVLISHEGISEDNEIVLSIKK